MRLKRALSGFFLSVATVSLVVSASAHTLDPRAVNHVIADPVSGTALFGYDPISYFLDRRAQPGVAEYMHEHDGRIWRFRTEANRAAFQQTPEAFVPWFGGHDATGVAEGRMITGDPQFFLIIGGELVLFRSAESRDRFAADADLRRQALAKWPQVVRQFAGH